MPAGSGRGGARPPGGTPPLEWAAAGLGAAALAALVGIMLWSGRGETEGAPLIEIRAEAPAPAGTLFRVGFVAENAGPSTAAAVRVRGTLLDGAGEAVETSAIELDYLPQRSARRGALLFARDPSAHRLELRAEGYVEP